MILGFGTLFAGAGFIGGSGAFDTVDADREITVEFADDSDAILGMAPAPDDGRAFVSVEETAEGTISIELDRVNRNSRTVIDNTVQFTNNGTRTIEEIDITIDDGSENAELMIHDALEDVMIDPGDSVVGLGFTVNTLNSDGYIGEPDVEGTITIGTYTDQGA